MKSNHKFPYSILPICTHLLSPNTLRVENFGKVSYERLEKEHRNNQNNQFVEQVVNSTGERLFYLLFFFNKELSRFSYDGKYN